ncbi:MAG: glycosyltransferase [Phycisphaerales bacterium]|nr:glycosyltransferase [Phycisphaerales bacterium]
MLTAFVLLLILITLFWLLVFCMGWSGRQFGLTYNAADPAEKLDHQYPPIGTSPAAQAGFLTDEPGITMIVPGRNEGHVLLSTLGSMCRQDYPNFNIIFVDDQSTDNTPEICRSLAAKYPHLTVLVNKHSPPPGWVGKNWAIAQALSMATREYVLFADSDIQFHPAVLHQAMRLAQRRQTDLLSLLPRPDGGGRMEQAFMLVAFMLVFAIAPPAHSNDPRRRHVMTAGAFMLFRRSVYDAIGRHEAVKGQIIEDLALGRRTKTAGYRVFSTFTQDLAFGRMYEGVADCFRGAKKNAYAGVRYNVLLLLAMELFLLLVGGLLPVYLLVAAMACWLQPGAIAYASFWMALAVNILAIAHVRRFRQWMCGKPGAEWLLTPAIFFAMAILAASAWDYYRGGNSWAGRTYERQHVEHPDDALAHPLPKRATPRSPGANRQ